MIDPLLTKADNKITSKPEIENIEREKQEYKLIGQYLRTRGLRMYSYNSLRNLLIEVKIDSVNTINLTPDEDGNLKAHDFAFEKITVDSRNIHFEALNMKNAKKRLLKFKQSKIKELCNLREPGEGINHW